MRNIDGLAALIGKAFWGLVVVDEAIIMKGRSLTSPRRSCAVRQSWRHAHSVERGSARVIAE